MKKKKNLSTLKKAYIWDVKQQTRNKKRKLTWNEKKAIFRFYKKVYD